MSTINISLPQEQVSLIDRLTKTYKFGSRSEFMRSLLRLIQFKPTLIADAVTYPFKTPPERSVKKIIHGFSKTNKYSAGFLKDLETGLRQSDFFKK